MLRKEEPKPEVGGRSEQLAARAPEATDSEASYLKAANRGQPAPHRAEDKAAGRVELRAHSANPL